MYLVLLQNLKKTKKQHFTSSILHVFEMSKKKNEL